MRSDIKKTALAVISLNLKSRMQLRDISQAELARQSGESAMQISRILQKTHMPNAYGLHQIAQALGSSVEDLMVDRM